MNQFVAEVSGLNCGVGGVIVAGADVGVGGSLMFKVICRSPVAASNERGAIDVALAGTTIQSPLLVTPVGRTSELAALRSCTLNVISSPLSGMAQVPAQV